MTNIDINNINNVTVAENGNIMNMTVKELKAEVKGLGIKGYSKMNRAELIAALKKFVTEEPVTADSVAEESVSEEKTDVKNQYLDSKWDKLVKATATEYVKQSLNVKWALFYKNTKATVTNGEYLVKTKKLWGATSKVIKSLYGAKHCSEKTIQQTLNAMVVRGYLNFQKVQGRNGINIIFNATADQMNAMFKLSK
jgi:hypothetical protein